METYTEELIETYEYFEDERILYKDSTYDIVSKVAYLIGVPKRIFENEHEPPKMDIYEILEKDKSARIVRNLCIVRAAIERNFGKINDKIRKEFKSIYTLPEYVPQDALRQLEKDGVNFYKKSSTKLGHHIIEINKIIRDRINNCKNIFPVWLNWDYIRDIFNMKNGLTEDGIKAAASVYFSNLECYPYSIYINWEPQQNGNILYNDKKFVTLLYQWHNDYFADYSKVSDAGSFVKSSIYDFIDDADKVVMAVDDERIMLKELTTELTQVFPDAEIQGFQNPLKAEQWAAQLAQEGKSLEYAFLDVRMREMNGLELARRLKLLHPKVILIFCTAYTEYAFEAVGMFAKGYLMKPISAEDIIRTLDEMVYDWRKTGSQKEQEIWVQTFGHFEVFVNGHPLFFEREKAKEMLAYLIDRHGASVTTEQLALVLWEDRPYDRTLKNYVSTILGSLRNTLRQADREDILIKTRNHLSIDPEKTNVMPMTMKKEIWQRSILSMENIW